MYSGKMRPFGLRNPDKIELPSISSRNFVLGRIEFQNVFFSGLTSLASVQGVLETCLSIDFSFYLCNFPQLLFIHCDFLVPVDDVLITAAMVARKPAILVDVFIAI